MASASSSRGLRLLMLSAMALNSALTVVLMRQSKLRRRNEGKQESYASSTVVFFTECVKAAVCLAFLLISKGLRRGLSSLAGETWRRPREFRRAAVPAVLYCLQNNVLYEAVARLDATTYQVTYQLKILTTALLSVFVLGRKLSARQWMALVMLTAGAVTVNTHSNHDRNDDIPTLEEKPGSSKEATVGLLLVLLACLTSAASGVAFEYLVKATAQTSIVHRNLQFALVSVPLTYLSTLADVGASPGGLVRGYDNMVLAIIALQSLGGLLVAVVVKYADNILKGFATSFSVVLASAASWLLLGDPPPASSAAMYLAGVAAVVAATLLYGCGAGGGVGTAESGRNIVANRVGPVLQDKFVLPR